MARDRDRAALAYTGVGLSFAAIVGAMTWLGHWLDRRLGTEPWLLVTGSLVGVAVATFDLIRTTSAIEARRRSKDR